MEARGRKDRADEASPDRARVYVQPKVKAFRKVQVIYYLSRNGQLEHPHFMEVTHLANHHLRLKDVIDRLTVLRGKGMPSLYSWSCKRSYKNGFVWSDLSENDVIHPSEGAEYVLKGSELIQGCPEQFHQQLQVMRSNQQYQRPRSRKPLPVSRNRDQSVLERMRNKEQEEEEEEDQVEEEEEEEYEEKRSNSSSCNTTTNYYQCSKGVSTDDIFEEKRAQNKACEITMEDASPPSTSSTVSDKTTHRQNLNNSQRFEDSDEPNSSRNSVFLQLIACGSLTSSAPIKGRTSITPPPPPTTTTPGLTNNNTSSSSSTITSNGRKSSSSSILHKGVLCKTLAVKKRIEEDDEMINYMSENPRFGNPQSEEKEYFSGSIVESITEHRVGTESTLKKSSSYNEERSAKSELAEQSKVVEERNVETKAKCLPRKKFSIKQGKK